MTDMPGVQPGPQALYIVVVGIRSVSIAMRDENGYYRAVLQMEYPFDRHETALQLCEGMNAIDVALEVPKTPGIPPKFVGTKA